MYLFPHAVVGNGPIIIIHGHYTKWSPCSLFTQWSFLFLRWIFPCFTKNILLAIIFHLTVHPWPVILLFNLFQCFCRSQVTTSYSAVYILQKPLQKTSRNNQLSFFFLVRLHIQHIILNLSVITTDA